MIRAYLADLWYRITRDPDPYPPAAAEAPPRVQRRSFYVPGPLDDPDLIRARFNAMVLPVQDIKPLLDLFAVEVDR